MAEIVYDVVGFPTESQWSHQRAIYTKALGDMETAFQRYNHSGALVHKVTNARRNLSYRLLKLDEDHSTAATNEDKHWWLMAHKLFLKEIGHLAELVGRTSSGEVQ